MSTLFRICLLMIICWKYAGYFPAYMQHICRIYAMHISPNAAYFPAYFASKNSTYLKKILRYKPASLLNAKTSSSTCMWSLSDSICMTKLEQIPARNHTVDNFPESTKTYPETTFRPAWMPKVILTYTICHSTAALVLPISIMVSVFCSPGIMSHR